MSFKLVCLDPGFSSLGFATMVFDGDAFKVDRLGVFETEKSNKKLKIGAVDDNLRRAMEIAGKLRDLVSRGPRTVAICAEAMSFPRSASVAAKMAMTWGAMAALSEAVGVPILQTSPQEVKRAVTGIRTATKEEVQDAVARLYPEVVKLREEVQSSKKRLRKDGKPSNAKERAGRPPLWEHAHDAVAVGHAMLGSEQVKLAKLMA